MTAGRFIVFEGGEGTGKSTQCRLLAEALRGRGLGVLTTREPGGTPGAEAIRDLLLAPPGAGWGPRAEALLFAAARADHVHRLIRPALERGDWVICDRFVDSSRAYQGAASGLGDEAIRNLHRFGVDGLQPDQVLVLNASPELVQQRLLERDRAGSDAIGGRDPAYHARVNESFAQFARAEPGRYTLIDADGSVDEVHRRVMQALGPILDEKITQ